MNQVNLMGNVTRDIELKESSNHYKYVRFVLAVNAPMSKEKSTDFFEMVAFGALAEKMALYVAKGTKLAISGHLATEKFTNKEGITRTSTKIIVENFEFANKKKEAELQAATEQIALTEDK